MMPTANVPTGFQELDLTATAVNRYLDANTLRTIKLNHNWLVSNRLCNDILAQSYTNDQSSEYLLPAFGVADGPPDVVASEYVYLAYLPIRPHACALNVCVVGQGDVANSKNTTIFPLIAQISHPFTLGSASPSGRLLHSALTTIDMTLPIPQLPKGQITSGAVMYMFALQCGRTTALTPVVNGASVLASTADSVVINVSFNISSYPHAAIKVGSTGAIARRIMASSAVTGGTALTINRPWVKQPIAGVDLIYIYKTYCGSISSIVVREVPLTTFSDPIEVG